MQYFDKNGKEIKAGMKILMDDGSVELVYATEDSFGKDGYAFDKKHIPFSLIESGHFEPDEETFGKMTME